ncbi:Uncharacterised protein [Escherichia coli]|uniref:Uncharacterized protein n=1 Tax=Escherichia coli TaxID=562 RepID=A0A2X3JPN8_ECOLX|nr:Uncharacterised protein [Escherichia coli]
MIAKTVPRVPPVHILAEKKVNPSMTNVNANTPFRADCGTGPWLKLLSCDTKFPFLLFETQKIRRILFI